MKSERVEFGGRSRGEVETSERNKGDAGGAKFSKRPRKPGGIARWKGPASAVLERTSVIEDEVDEIQVELCHTERAGQVVHDSLRGL